MRLTPFEEYLYREDRRSYPCWMVLKCEFRGRLHRESIERAWRMALKNNPMMTATLIRGKFGRLFWQFQPDTLPPPIWKQADRRTFQLVLEPFDLEREGGVRFFIVEDEDRFDFYFQVHHAALDGLGGFQICHEILLHYQREQGHEIEIPKPRVELLEGRNRFLHGWGERIRAFPRILKGVLVSSVVQGHRGLPLVPHEVPEDEDPPPPGWPNIIKYRFPVETYGALRKAARDRKVNLNEILIRDFQEAAGNWMRKKHYGDSERWIRLAVPVNLRSPGDRNLPAANRISVITLDRKLRSLSTERRSRLLFRANEDMTRVKDEGLDRTFLWMLALYRRLPGGIRARFDRRHCVSTAVLTFLGRIFSVGPLVNEDRKLEIDGAVLEDLYLVAPLRPQSLVSMDIYVYAKRLNLDFHYDPRYLPETEARELLNGFVENIKKSGAGK